MKNVETQRQLVLEAMSRRPQDPWPRWQGHVVLGIPGCPRQQKAYHEPGGGFSPSAGSFGVSVHLNTEATEARTGDELPLAEVDQQYLWATEKAVPSIRTITPYYNCRWAHVNDESWALDIETADDDSSDTAAGLQLLIRSVGPAGGPIERLDWDGRQLIVNRRWVLTFGCAPLRIHLGSEEDPGWLTAEKPINNMDVSDGWGYARIELPAGRCRMTIRDTAPFFLTPLAYNGVKTTLKLDLPDEAFTASLEAQAANLLMGFVGRQTCPGEPTNYPLAWERDGAYSVVAMARCGQTETAKQLAVYFAENDFFGGFGAEGDAPGSAINALVTVALISGDREFQRWCWPHVKRKIGLIEEMASARQEIHKPWVGPIVPEHRGKDGLPIICQPSRGDVIMGSMDLHYPALYINSMSFRGLNQAISLAKAIGTQDEIPNAPALAERLQRGWHDNLGIKEYDNERTYMSGLWPTWIVDPDCKKYHRVLEQRWKQENGEGTYPTRPLWTYFTIAEAHQWLFMDQPEITWKTLQYFWHNQSSPGLYTYWEGEKEENSFGLWQDIRGWVQPKLVTPHYWTASEMLLLQIDMLAYVNEAGPEPVLVIGGGVHNEWLTCPFSITGLPTILGMVDWSYDGEGTLDVTLHSDRPYNVRAGREFGPDVHINLNPGRI